ncbi:MAG: triose-phosphate isomerase [Candidatus Kerfeldbacteria bacterium]
MRTPLIAANWKMNKTVHEAEEFVQELKNRKLPDNREVLIGAPFTVLLSLTKATSGSDILVAAENMFYEEQGAFTGEISPIQLLDVGCTHVIIGHSERRHIFGESDELLNKKLLACEKHGLIPVFCVGETLEERKADKAEAVVLGQYRAGIAGLSDEFIQNMVVAYEPVWAIGTGENATPEQAEEMHALLRKELPESTRILYGGSVKPDNAAQLMNQPSIDGFLIGGASLEIDDFYRILTVDIKK